QDCRIIGLSLYPTVPRTIVRLTVTVVFAIGFVVLLIVRNEISQCKAIMSSNKVDAGVWTATGRFVQIRTASDAKGEFPQTLFFAPPEIANAVAIAAVPFRPLGWKVANLITAFTQIPRLGDQFHSLQY